MFAEAPAISETQSVVLCASTAARRLRIASLLRDHGGFRIVGICEDETKSEELRRRLDAAIVIDDARVRSFDPVTQRRLELLLVNDLVRP